MKRLLPGETQLVLSAAKIHKVWVAVWVQNSTIKQQKLKNITSEKFTGRHYEIMEYTGAADAEKVIVIMGSGALTTELVIRNLVKNYN